MNIDERDNYLEILKNNKGFDEPEKWIDYAASNRFKKVIAKKIYRCPDCGNNETQILGQYIYYSNLLQARKCKACGLVFADARINSKTIADHFEASYKEEDYFIISRDKIFTHITRVISPYIKENGKILDIGGAKGHLARKLKTLRGDIDVTVNDISKEACRYINSQYGYSTICCPISDLQKQTDIQYDGLLVIDVLYYEENISAAFRTIIDLVKKNGVIVLRVPNKLWLINVVANIKKVLMNKERQQMLDRMSFVNPEHIYIFSRKYIEKKFKKIGANKITFQPSKTLMTTNKYKNVIANVFYSVSIIIYWLTFKKLVITSAQIIVVQK